jgi:putative endonuclease
VETREAPAGQWGVYMVRCGDGTLYTGATCHLERRLDTHNRGRGAAYTRARLPVTLVYWEPAPDKRAALRREWAVKQLSRAEKLTLQKSAPKKKSPHKESLRKVAPKKLALHELALQKVASKTTAPPNALLSEPAVPKTAPKKVQLPEVERPRASARKRPRRHGSALRPWPA